MPAPAVAVEGLRDLQRAFALADVAAKKELRSALKEIGEPIARDAESLATARISRIGKVWPQMRVGVTQNLVYVAPKQRGRASRQNRALRRPNLFDLLMGRAMEPALDANIAGVDAALERVFDRVGSAWERA